MDVYEFLREQRMLQNKRMNLGPNGDGNNNFMKRALGNESHS